jgi:hypothetical protein
LGIHGSQHVLGVLDDGVLEASAGAEEGEAAFSCETDCAQRAFHAAVGAARRAQKAVETFETFALAALQSIRGQPSQLYIHSQGCGAMPKRFVCRLVRRALRVEIADDADSC